jgi:hypothetical protein
VACAHPTRTCSLRSPTHCLYFLSLRPFWFILHSLSPQSLPCLHPNFTSSIELSCKAQLQVTEMLCSLTLAPGLLGALDNHLTCGEQMALRMVTRLPSLGLCLITAPAGPFPSCCLPSSLPCSQTLSLLSLAWGPLCLLPEKEKPTGLHFCTCMVNTLLAPGFFHCLFAGSGIRHAQVSSVLK